MGDSVGRYPIWQGTLAANANYTIGFTGHDLTITPAPLTVTANDQSRMYGAPNPAFTVAYNGFVNGEGVGVLIGGLTCSTTAIATSLPSPPTYPITCWGQSAVNYNVINVPGALTVLTPGAIVPVHGRIHVVDPGKSGICGINPSNGKAHAECKLWPDPSMSEPFPEAGEVVVRLYDMKNAAFKTEHGSDPGPDKYKKIFGTIYGTNDPTAPNGGANPVGLVGTCVVPKETPTPKPNGKLAGFGEALCGVPAPTDLLVLGGYKDYADLKGKPRENLDVNVVFGKRVDASSFKSTPTNNKLDGSLKTAVVPSGPGILWSQPRDIHAQKMYRKDGIIQYADAGKTVYLGSYLEVVYPTYTVWDEGLTRYLYPFIMTSDSDWDLDVCASVPEGYNIVGVYDADGNVMVTSNCVQALVAGETKVIAFDVVDLQSPPPHLKTKLKIRHKGKVTNTQIDIPGHRKGKDKMPK